MSFWRPRHSVLLSVLLDDVIGTPEIIGTRQELCRQKDCVNVRVTGDPVHYTGSQSEGLELPGSDKDFMQVINKTEKLEILEQDKSVSQPNGRYRFVVVTNNVHPAFAMLRSINPPSRGIIAKSLQKMDGSKFLSSYLTISNYLHNHSRNFDCSNLKIQGPSIEHSTKDKDVVISIHCSFWPAAASEWDRRSRSNNWPTIDAIKNIKDFGFHLVPIGFSRSSMNMMEWRISFSVAERYLAWSFNHIQMQMYAILKIILKEFIKVNCRAENYVMCSYFIKTFLFWVFESTDKGFWRIENFRDCLKYLLIEFHKTLQCGILKHYFIPSFNLLEVKMTRAAQLELMQLYDLAIQYDIKIIEKCPTLKKVWFEFSNRMSASGIPQCNSLQENSFCNLSKHYFIKKTKVMMRYSPDTPDKSQHIMDALNAYSDTTNNSIGLLWIRRFRLMNYLSIIDICRPYANKYVYKLFRLLYSCSSDIATNELWTAILFLMKEDYSMALRTVNKLLSSIPPYALYYRKCPLRRSYGKYSGFDPKIIHVYAEIFFDSELDISQIARRAWLFDFSIFGNAIAIMPISMQLDKEITFSPFIFAYYLQFLCYYGLRQFDNRDRALRQLVEVAENPEQCGCDCIKFPEYKLVGHCFLHAGQTVRAKEMFIKAYQCKRDFEERKKLMQ